MARPSRETVSKQFKEAEDEKMLAWTKKNPPPAPPTEVEILADIKAGRFKAADKCACTRRDFDYQYRAPDEDDFHIDKLIEVRCVARFLKAGKEYKVRLDAFKKRLTRARNDLQNPVLYSKANFVDNLVEFHETHIV